MARDFEDSINNIDDLTDEDLHTLVRAQLTDHPGLDIEDLEIEVENGMVRLNGRVATEGELRMADHVLTDVIGIPEVDNEMVVDPNVREETPLDIEDHLVVEQQTSGLMLGEVPEQQSPEVDQTRGDEDLDERLFGTVNMQDAIAHGTSYNPPYNPTPEGIRGTDAGPAEKNERH